ncbi:FkbM family methyltransferase [Hyphococcus luteus]|nr:FkbM family methyltransferase [Marinicaulis flavus]
MNIADAVEALFKANDGLKGRNFKDFTAALKQRGIIAFRDKFTARYLRQLGFEAKTIFDVGVNRGTPELYQTFLDRKIVLVEPLGHHIDAIKKKWPKVDFDAHIIAAGKEDAQIEVPLTPITGHFSLKSRAGLHLDASNAVPVKVRRLDELTQEYGYDGPYGLKIDIEGHEYDCLLGCSSIMDKVEFVIAECQIKKIFVGVRPISATIALMAEYGFEIYDVLNARAYAPNQLDFLFLKRDDERFVFNAEKSKKRIEMLREAEKNKKARGSTTDA